MNNKLTHPDKTGNPNMVDVGAKPIGRGTVTQQLGKHYTNRICVLARLT